MSEKFSEIDAMLAKLRATQASWTQVSFAKKLELLKKIRQNIGLHQDEWVRVAATGKKMDDKIAAEEYQGGPFATLRTVNGLIACYENAAASEASGKPIKFAPLVAVHEVNGQKRVKVYPTNSKDGMVSPGVTAEQYLLPGKDATQGSELLEAKRIGKGAVSLVLGAGNQTSIPILDAIHKLYVENQVVLLKHNPVSEWLYPIVDKVMEPLISMDVMHHTKGGADVGQYLTQQCDNVHITGSDKTHDAIVWGVGAEKKADPKYKKEVTAELGCVTPCIIVPGQLTPAELTYLAQHLTGAICANDSFNCVAAKVIITSKNWPQRRTLIDEMKKILGSVAPRHAWYPGADQRYNAFLERYKKQVETVGTATADDVLPWALIPDVPATGGEYAFMNEAFAPVCVETSIDATDVPDFLNQVVTFINKKDNIWGNLSMSYFCDGRTESQYKAELETAIDATEYGTVALNAWSGVAYGLGGPCWGAYHGNEIKDIQSGRGFVHNTFMLDHPQKCVLRAPFMLTMGAKWPYFPTHKNLLPTMSALCKFEANGQTTFGLMKALWNALWG